MKKEKNPMLGNQQRKS